MPESPSISNIDAPTLYLKVNDQTYGYRRFGSGAAPPLLLLQHFTGTLDNWDPAVTDALAQQREVILFDNAGVGRSSGKVPETIAGMTGHVLTFLEQLEITSCDILGFSLGGMIAQEIARRRPSIVRKMLLVGTAPRGGEDIMHMEKPALAAIMNDPSLKGYARLQKLFFAPSDSSQAAGAAFVRRLSQRTQDREPPSGADVAKAQLTSFRDWEQPNGKPFSDLETINQPVLVVHGVHDAMIPVSNAYWLSQHLPNAVLLTYPDSGHGALFQFHDSFTRQACAFLASDSAVAPY
jgi:pimeloyl-ACP methyl ester carboxylesterase